MSVESLPAAVLVAALWQMVNAPGFDLANSHLSAAETAAIILGQWPNVPVFSPYATTHHGYSQIRLAGTKYLLHRVTYQSFYHDLTANSDVSHILYLGMNTTRNINPMFLVMEPNIINQTRKACALFMEEKLNEWADGMVGAPSWAEGDFVRWVRSVNVVCATIHGGRTCSCNPLFWEPLGSVNDLGQF